MEPRGLPVFDIPPKPLSVLYPKSERRQTQYTTRFVKRGLTQRIKNKVHPLSLPFIYTMRFEANLVDQTNRAFVCFRIGYDEGNAGHRTPNIRQGTL